MLNLEIFLSKILMICIPFGVFIFIVAYKQHHTEQYTSEDIDVIEQYLLDYFSLCNEALDYKFDTDVISIEADHFPTETLGDMNVYCNGYYCGSLASYFLDEKKYAYALYRVLLHSKRKIWKPKEIVVLLKQLHEYTSIYNGDIREEIYAVENTLQKLQEEKQINQHVKNYVYILLDLLERYKKLEEVNQIDEKTTQRVLRILPKVNQRFSQILFEQNDFDKKAKKS